MKKNLLIILICLFSIWFSFNYTFAASGEVRIIVTEKIPWAKCDYEKKDGTPTWNYICTVKKGFAWVMETLGQILQYLTYIVSILWVLFIVYNWILYSASWIEEWAKDTAKKRIIWTLVGLLLLLLSAPLLRIIAPWIYWA